MRPPFRQDSSDTTYVREIRLGRIAGIPISASISVLGIAGIVIYSLAFDILPRLFPTAPLVDRLMAAGASALLFLFSILFHELGHALLANKHGVGVDGISLWLLGGVAKLTKQAPTPRAEFDIAIAGPAGSLLIGMVFSGLALAADRVGILGPGPAVLAWLGIINMLIAITNLFPVAPLDGGRVLTAALWKRSGKPEWARLQAARAGLVAGVGLMVLAVAFLLWSDQRAISWFSLAVMGAFLFTAARSEVVGAAVRQRLTTTRVDAVMAWHPASVPDTTPVDRFAAWASPSAFVAHPVTRWSHEPVGYVTAASRAGLSPAEQSWRSVADLMVPIDLVPRAWGSESADEVLRRLETSFPLAAVHNEADNQVIGTISQQQIHQLIASVNWWGRLATVEPSTKPVWDPVRG